MISISGGWVLITSASKILSPCCQDLKPLLSLNALYFTSHFLLLDSARTEQNFAWTLLVVLFPCVLYIHIIKQQHRLATNRVHAYFRSLTFKETSLYHYFSLQLIKFSTLSNTSRFYSKFILFCHLKCYWIDPVWYSFKTNKTKAFLVLWF